MEFLPRRGRVELVKPRQVIPRSLQLARPRRHDVDDGRRELLSNPAARLEVVQRPRLFLRPGARQILDHRLEDHELRHLQFVAIELPLQPVNARVVPKLLEIAARRDDQLDAVEAESADDVNGGLGVGRRPQIVETPTQAADLRPARRRGRRVGGRQGQRQGGGGGGEGGAREEFAAIQGGLDFHKAKWASG